MASQEQLDCRVYWGSHGCNLERGHEGHHRCDCADAADAGDVEWQSDDEAENVGAYPYYGPNTTFYGEDAPGEQHGSQES